MEKDEIKKYAESLEGLASAGFAKKLELGKEGENAIFNYLFKPSAKAEGKDFLQRRSEESMKENGGQLIVNSDSDTAEAHSQYIGALSEMRMRDFLNTVEARAIDKKYISKEDLEKKVKDLAKDGNESALEIFNQYSQLKLTERVGGAIIDSSEGVGRELDESLSRMEEDRFKKYESKLLTEKKKHLDSKNKTQKAILENELISKLYTVATVGNQYGENGKEMVTSAFARGDWDDNFMDDFYLKGIEDARRENKSSVNLTKNAKDFYESAILSMKVSNVLGELKAEGDRLTESQKDMYMFEMMEEDEGLAGEIAGAYMKRINASNVGSAMKSNVEARKEAYDKKYSKPKEE